MRVIAKVEPTKVVMNLLDFAEEVIKLAEARGLVSPRVRKYKKRGPRGPYKKAKKVAKNSPAPKKVAKPKPKVAAGGNAGQQHPLEETEA